MKGRGDGEIEGWRGEPPVGGAFSPILSPNPVLASEAADCWGSAYQEGTPC